MPPEKNNPAASSSPNQFDFILKEQPKPKRAFKIPKNPIALAVIGLVLLLMIAIIGSLLGGGGGNTNNLHKAIATANDIARVSDEVTSTSTNADVKNLAATTEESLSSQAQQMTAQINTKDKKVLASLSAVQNTTIDGQLNTALVNNNYDQTYLSYLKTSLNEYLGLLQTAYKTVGSRTKAVISSAYSSTQTLLTSPPLQ